MSEKRRDGMHSRRHTLSTRLMEDGTPVEQIADILGHKTVAATGAYLKSSLGLLTQCVKAHNHTLVPLIFRHPPKHPSARPASRPFVLANAAGAPS